MLKQLILATAATALAAAPATAKDRHHRHNQDVYRYAMPWIGTGNWYRPNRHGAYQVYDWNKAYRSSHHRNGDWDDDDHHRRHGDWYGNDQGEDNDDQGEDEDD